MNNKKGFTLIELLVVIAILAIITVLGVTTILPYMSEARKDAFRIEATEIVTAGKDAVRLYEIGQVSLKNNSASCKKLTKEEYCFTVAELINLALYDGDSNTFSGKLIINNENQVKPVYHLYFRKKVEFKIIDGQHENYKELGNINDLGNWEDSYEACDCSES